MKFVDIQFLSSDLLPSALEIDQMCLGGLWSLDNYQRELESPNSDLLVLSVRSPDINSNRETLVGLGCVWAILEEAHITLLAVHPDYQRLGFGQTLLYALLMAAWQRQLEWATLEVRVSNQKAIALYQKFGFQSIGQRRRYYQDTGEDALILWRSGLQKPDFTEALAQWLQGIHSRLGQAGWTFRNKATGKG